MTRLAKESVCVVMLLFVVGCDTGASLGEPFNMSVGETSHVDDLALTLIKAIDSRCAVNVVCIWEGEIGGDVELRKVSSGEIETTYLSTTMKREYAFGGYIIRLVDAQAPTPYHGKTIPQKKYRFKFMITHAE